MYKMRIKVNYCEKVINFKDFQQVQDFLRYLVDGSEEATNVDIWREDEPMEVEANE
jgi:hypothetical protein